MLLLGTAAAQAPVTTGSTGMNGLEGRGQLSHCCVRGKDVHLRASSLQLPHSEGLLKRYTRYGGCQPARWCETPQCLPTLRAGLTF